MIYIMTDLGTNNFNLPDLNSNKCMQLCLNAYLKPSSNIIPKKNQCYFDGSTDNDITEIKYYLFPSFAFIFSDYTYSCIHYNKKYEPYLKILPSILESNKKVILQHNLQGKKLKIKRNNNDIDIVIIEEDNPIFYCEINSCFCIRVSLSNSKKNVPLFNLNTGSTIIEGIFSMNPDLPKILEIGLKKLYCNWLIVDRKDFKFLINKELESKCDKLDFYEYENDKERITHYLY